MAEKKEQKKVSLETMAGVGKEVQLAGRTYIILPVNIRDMHLIIGNAEEEAKLIIPTKMENIDWHIFGLNITEKDRKSSFMYVVNKYVYYKIGNDKIPMTEELLEEHNWSFKEIGMFLKTWAEISD